MFVFTLNTPANIFIVIEVTKVTIVILLKPVLAIHQNLLERNAQCSVCLEAQTHEHLASRVLVDVPLQQKTASSPVPNTFTPNYIHVPLD